MARLGREGGDCDWGFEGHRQRDCDARTTTIRPGWLGIRLRAACVRNCLSLGRGVALRIVGQDARPETLCEVSRVHGASELVHAPSRYPAPRVGGDGCRDIARNPADIRMVVAMGRARDRRSAGDVRDSDGDFLWTQITDGLLGVLGFGRGSLAGAASVHTAPATVFPKSNVRTIPRTEVQHFGNGAIVLSSYVVETELEGTRSSSAGTSDRDPERCAAAHAVDPETYEVRADGRLLTCEPASVLPMAQRYFLY